MVAGLIEFSVGAGFTTGSVSAFELSLPLPTVTLIDPVALCAARTKLTDCAEMYVVGCAIPERYTVDAAPNPLPVSVTVVLAVPIATEDGEAEISCGGLVIAMLNPPLIAPDAPVWSVTCTVKLDVPASPVGVPEIAPDALRVSPAGNDPFVTVNVFAPLPPDTAIAVLG
jgi:hypothetical protein